MTGSSNMDNIIIAGARIYFPPDNRLPNASGDMLTFAVVRDPDTIPDYLLFVHKDGQWELASPRFSKKRPMPYPLQPKLQAVVSRTLPAE